MKKSIVDFGKLRKDLLSKNWAISLAASDRFGQIGGQETLKVLLSLLKSKRPDVRNSVALALKEIGHDKAVGPLMDAILNPANRRHTGTLVSALETHNCSELFLPMVKLALYGSYEVQCHALIILGEQKFDASQIEIRKARQLIENYKKRKRKCQDFHILLKELSRHVSKVEKQNQNEPRKIKHKTRARHRKK